MFLCLFPLSLIRYPLSVIPYPLEVKLGRVFSVR